MPDSIGSVRMSHSLLRSAPDATPPRANRHGVMLRMNGAVEGKVVAVTGITSGIGRACARSLAREGARVVGVARRAERAAAVADELRSAGFSMTALAGDVSRTEDCERFIDAVVHEHGRIDALVNNVGDPGSPIYQPSETVTRDRFDAGIAANLASAFFCSTRAIPHMKKQGGGSIVNVSSVVGNQAMAQQAVYAISKAAMDHLTRCFAVEYLEDKIRVNSVIIGGAATAAAARSIGELSALHGRAPDPDQLPPSMAATPLDEITDAITLLCSDRSRGITATAVAVDHARSAGAVFSAALSDALAGTWTR